MLARLCLRLVVLVLPLWFLLSGRKSTRRLTLCHTNYNSRTSGGLLGPLEDVERIKMVSSRKGATTIQHNESSYSSGIHLVNTNVCPSS